MENKELFTDLIEQLRKLNLSPEELSKRVTKALPLLYEEVLQDNKLYVIKRSGLLEEFIPRKLKNSMARASDDCRGPLGEAELNMLSAEVTKRVLEQGKIFYSRSLRDLVLELLYKYKHYQVYECYKKHE